MYKYEYFKIYFYSPQLKKNNRLIGFNLLFETFGKKKGTLHYFAVSNNQNQGENSGDSGLIMLGKEPKIARLDGLETGWLGGAWEEEMQKSISMFSGWDPQKKRKKIFGVTRGENSLLLFAELSLSL